MQDYTVTSLVETIHRTDCPAWRVGAVHACYGNRSFPGLAVIQRYHPAAIDAPRDLVFVFTRRNAGIAFDAAFGIT